MPIFVLHRCLLLTDAFLQQEFYLHWILINNWIGWISDGVQHPVTFDMFNGFYTLSSVNVIEQVTVYSKNSLINVNLETTCS